MASSSKLVHIFLVISQVKYGVIFLFISIENFSLIIFKNYKWIQKQTYPIEYVYKAALSVKCILPFLLGEVNKY